MTREVFRAKARRRHSHLTEGRPLQQKPRSAFSSDSQTPMCPIRYRRFYLSAVPGPENRRFPSGNVTLLTFAAGLPLRAWDAVT